MDDNQAAILANNMAMVSLLTQMEHHARMAREMFTFAEEWRSRVTKPSIAIAGRIGANGHAPVHDPNQQAAQNMAGCRQAFEAHLQSLAMASAKLIGAGNGGGQAAAEAAD